MASILSFHGGGFLGYFSACVIDRLEARRQILGAGTAIGGAVDMIAGNSAGAILAAGIAAGVPAGRIVGLMREGGERIFPRRRWAPRLPGLFAARFRQDALRDLLEVALGDRRLGELDQALLIPAVSETRGEPVLFRSHDPDQAHVRLVDAVLASAAAPLYLPLHRIAGERYADGGLVANAPELLAAADLRNRFGVPFADQRVLSIGVAAPAPSPPGMSRRDDWAALNWIYRGRLQALIMGGQVRLQREILTSLGLADLVHLDQTLPADGPAHMLLADAAARAALEAAAVACMTSCQPETVTAIDRLLMRQRRYLAFRREGRAVLPVLLDASGR